MTDKAPPQSAPAQDEKDPAWLALPETKKAVARSRALVFDEYTALAVPSQGDLAEAMAALNLGRTRFYSLLRKWTRRRSLIDLAPHVRGRSRVEEGIADEAGRAGDEIVARVIEGAALKRDATVPPFSLNAKSPTGHVAHSFGEVLVIDHPRPDLFVAADDAEFRPSLSLVIDLFSTTVLGSRVYRGDPTADEVRQAIVDAVNRTGSLAPAGNRIPPTILLPADWSTQWRELEKVLKQAGADVVVRRSPKLHRGHVSRRLVGTRIDEVKLLTRQPRHDFRTAKSVPSRHAVLSIEDARLVIDAAIARRNGRLMPGTWPAQLDLEVERLTNGRIAVADRSKPS